MRFSSEVLEGFLRKVYEGFDVSSEIEPTAWREVLRLMNEASVEGLVSSGHTLHEESFLRKLKHSNEVFSAFKVHSMGVKMAERLRDKDGKLRPYKEWVESVQGIASHHTGAWLRTEYDTAVLRAHQASDWQEFERNRDILPNLKWMPTTSPSPDTVHEGFWSAGLTLPIDDPFWIDNHPANRWNCKCSLEATDEPASDSDWAKDKHLSTSQHGLESNPRLAQTFSDKHPYYPKGCRSCSFYKRQNGISNWLRGIFDNRNKDCYNCPYIDWELAKAKYPEQYKKYLSLQADTDYKEVEFDVDSGGIKATHIGHNSKSTKDTYFGSEKITSKQLEDECVDILFKSGRTVILQNESKRGADGNILSALDLSVNGKGMDIRSITEASDNYKNALTAKNKQLFKYNSRADVIDKADTVCLYFHEPSMFSDKRIRTSIYSYIRLTSGNNEYGRQIKRLIVVLGGDKRSIHEYEV